MLTEKELEQLYLHKIVEYPFTPYKQEPRLECARVEVLSVDTATKSTPQVIIQTSLKHRVQFEYNEFINEVTIWPS